MIRIFHKQTCKKGQNVAEYAILIALVVGAIIAMQRFAQRALQARVYDASRWMTEQGGGDAGGLGQTAQYEPYYAQSDYRTDRVTEEERAFGEDGTSARSLSDSARQEGGHTATTYGGAAGLGEVMTWDGDNDE